MNKILAMCTVAIMAVTTLPTSEAGPVEDLFQVVDEIYACASYVEGCADVPLPDPDYCEEIERVPGLCGEPLPNTPTVEELYQEWIDPAYDCIPPVTEMMAHSSPGSSALSHMAFFSDALSTQATLVLASPRLLTAPSDAGSTGGLADALAAAMSHAEDPASFLLAASAAHGVSANDISDVPTELLVLAALTAEPQGSQTLFHAHGAGSQWMEMAEARYAALSRTILDQYVATYGDSGDWPSDAFLNDTARLRLERALVGVALFDLTMHEANSRGLLAEAVPVLGQIVIATSMDLHIANSASVASSHPCHDIANLYVTVAALVQSTLDLLFGLEAIILYYVDYLPEFVGGVWYDTLSPLEGAVSETFDQLGGVDTSVADVVLNGIVKDMQTDSSAMDAYHGGLLLALGVIGTGVRALPDGGARTDDVGHAVWEIAALQGIVAQQEFDWTIPLPTSTIEMNDGLMATASAGPIFEEEGTIWQNTWKDYLLIEQTSQMPRWTTEDAEWSTGQCAAASIAAGAAGAGIVAGAAAGAGPAAAAGPWGWAAYGGALHAAGTAWIDGVDDLDDKCGETAVYDEGFFLEIGMYRNYWANMAWFGKGVSLAGGIVSIYGSANLNAALNYMEPEEYDNKEAKGYYRGKELAEEKRILAEDQSMKKLPQFRSLLASGGNAHITLEILCAGLGEYFDVRNPDDANMPMTPVTSDTDICLEIELGTNNPPGGLVGEGYGSIELSADGNAAGGYLSVNGNSNSVPAVINLDASGANYRGEP